MADFLTDYSGVAAAGAGFNSFADAFERAQDNKAKRQEMQARMQAEQTKAQREADQTAIQAKIAGLQKNAITGNFDEAPMSPAAQGRQKLDVFKAGGQGQYDDNGNITGVSVDPDSMNMLKIQNGLAQKQFSNNLAQQRIANTGENIAFREHKAAVSAVGDDKQSKDLLNGYQSINNALVNFKASGGMPQEFHQLQNSLRLNAGSGNRTGVEERSKGYASDWGISKDEAMQIITGNISDVSLSSPKMVKAIMGISEAEIKNKQLQASQQIQKKAGMMKGVYSKGKAGKFQPEFDDTVKNQYNQFGLDDQGQPQGQSQGLVGGQGLVKPGLVGGGQQAAPAQAKPKTVMQKGPDGTMHTYTLNPQTGQYE